MKNKKTAFFAIIITLVIVTTSVVGFSVITITKNKPKAFIAVEDIPKTDTLEAENTANHSMLLEDVEEKADAHEFPILFEVPEEVKAARQENLYSATLLYSDGVFEFLCNSNLESPQEYRTYYFDKEGKLLANGNFGIAYPVYEGFGCISRDGKYGFIDKEGQEVIPLIYDKTAPFSDGLAYFEKGDSYGFMDTAGKEVFTLDCDSVSSFREGFAYFSIDGKYGYIDKTGQVAIEPVYDDAGYFSEGKAQVRLGCVPGTIDSTGHFEESTSDEDNVMEMYGYESSWQIEGTDYYVVKRDKKYGLIDGEGNMKLPVQYEFIHGSYGAFGNDIEQGNWIAVEEETGWKILSLNDFKPITSEIYEDSPDLGTDCAVVITNGKYGVINTECQTIIPFEYDAIFMYDNDRFIVKADNKEALINSKGEQLSQWYGHMRQVGECYICSCIDSGDALVDKDGTEIIKGNDYNWLSYDAFYLLENKMIQVKAESIEKIHPLVLVNNITPRKKAYHDMQMHASNTFFDKEDMADFYEEFRLYKVANIEQAVLYYAESPFMADGPVSNFFLEKEGKYIDLCSAEESGGSMGGTGIQLFYDNENEEITYGYSGHYGGFGGYGGGFDIYRYQNGESVLIGSTSVITQVMGNYSDEDEQTHPELFYREDGSTYTADDIADAESATTYYVGDELVTRERYDEITARFSLIKMIELP